MSDMKSILRDVGYFTVGAAAVLVEAGSKAAKCLIRKGEATLRDNQDTVDDLKRRARDLGEKAKALGEKAKTAVEKASKPEEPIVNEPTVDEPECACEPECAEPVRPVAPDVIYHTDVPAEDEADAPDDPANTVNG